MSVLDTQELIKAAQVEQSTENAPQDQWYLGLLSADEILTKEWPEPTWAVPGILPVGLTILAGAPKVGKSWLALQIAQSVAAGGVVFGSKVESGPVLYLALEDPPRRLKERMAKQSWPNGLRADFMTVGSFYDRIGDLRNGGGERIAQHIERKGYRMVTIDTLSRAIFADQNDVRDMTNWLTPLQEMAHSKNCAIVMVDHHKKSGGFDPDAIADILGSTAKGAMVDTAIGLYRERGKPGAKMCITGRDVEERTLSVKIDWMTGCWQVDENIEGLTEQQADLLGALRQIGPCGVSEIAEAVLGDKEKRGLVYQQLSTLEGKGLVLKDGMVWDVVSK